MPRSQASSRRVAPKSGLRVGLSKGCRCGTHALGTRRPFTPEMPMKRSLLATLALLGTLSGGTLLLDGMAGSDPSEKLVNPNLLRVLVNGSWVEFPLMPLADQACSKGRGPSERNCTDDAPAPGPGID